MEERAQVPEQLGRRFWNFSICRISYLCSTRVATDPLARQE